MRADRLSVSVLVLFAIWLAAVLVLGVAAEWHHAYFGVLAISPEVPRYLRWPGAAALLDDTGQHVAQIWRPEFRSPLHELAAAVGII